MCERTDCSVIIPAYNAEKTIAAAVKSLYQDATSRFRIEACVIDDGSSDRTADIAAELAERYPLLRLIRKENGGVSSARNAGLEAANGYFICFLDADDELERPALEEMIEKGYETGADMLIAGFERFDEASQKAEIVEEKFEKETLLGESFIKNEIFPCFIDGDAPALSPLWNKLYVREKIAGLRFNLSRTHGEDWEFNIRYLETAESVWFADCVMYRYRCAAAQSMSKYKKGLRQGYIEGYRLLRELIEKYSLESKDEKIFTKLMQKTAFRFIGFLKMEDVPDREKKDLLGTEEAKEIFSAMAKLDTAKLAEMDLSRKDKAAFWLLSKGDFRLALRII